MSDSTNTNNNSQLSQLLSQLADAPDTVHFNQVLEVIDNYYDFTPTRFTSGEGAHQRINEAGTNEGSCKVFGFALLHSLDRAQTLHCFGDYYRVDVLQNPEGVDHGNIRNFLRSEWAGIEFDVPPL
ncbi:MAG: HopJ type III effector protein, partial [Gammaproteobacteria bacterium]|nr:HopJ type III effector protein [Gammaproteobacteria bacterium]